MTAGNPIDHDGADTPADESMPIVQDGDSPDDEQMPVTPDAGARPNWPGATGSEDPEN